MHCLSQDDEKEPQSDSWQWDAVSWQLLQLIMMLDKLDLLTETPRHDSVYTAPLRWGPQGRCQLNK